MRNETLDLINNLYPYFKMLDNINNYLTQVIDNNMYNNPYQNSEKFYNITSELMRLIPYKYDKKENIIALQKEDGILLLSNNFNFIEEQYNKIVSFKPFKEELIKVIKIRNKYIHEPHNIVYAFEVGGSTSCSVGFYYKSELLSVSSISLTAIAYYLNKIFERIQKETLERIDNTESLVGNYVYDTFCQFNFSESKWHYTILPDYLMWGFNILKND